MISVACRRKENVVRWPANQREDAARAEGGGKFQRLRLHIRVRFRVRFRVRISGTA